MIKKLRKWLYKKAFDYVMYNHRRSLDDTMGGWTRLSFKNQMLEYVDFTEAQFHYSSFNRARFLISPHNSVLFDACDFHKALFLKSDLGVSQFHSCLMHGVDWTGTFSGEMKDSVERLSMRKGIKEDLDKMSVVATGHGVKLQLDEPVLPRIKPKRKK